MRRYMKYGGHEEQQARQDMENCPIMPYLVIAFIVGHMQFDSGVCGQDKHGNQAPVYYKNLFSNAMRALCQILKDEKDYKKLYHCAEKAAVIYPLEE